MLLSLFNFDASRISPHESMKWRPGGFPGGHGGVDGQAGGRQPSLELAVGVTPPGGAKLPAWLPQPHLVQDNVAPVWVQPQFSVPPAWHFGSHQQFIYRLYFILSWLNTTLIWKTAPLNTRQLHNSAESFLDICRAAGQFSSRDNKSSGPTMESCCFCCSNRENQTHYCDKVNVRKAVLRRTEGAVKVACIVDHLFYFTMSQIWRAEEDICILYYSICMSINVHNTV